MEESIVFENFVSLGAKCPVAASMAKFGLRSWSGVFDWLITDDFQWVLYYIENDFAGFFEKENLERYSDDPTKFREKTSGFLFIHENDLFEQAYEKIKEKYEKRIAMFLSETQKSTCFLRAVGSKDEMEYIKSNYEYINKVIKKNQENNQIVFLIEKGLEVDEFPFRFYEMNSNMSGTTRLTLRSFFDGCPEFAEFCLRHFSYEKVVKNIIFDNEMESLFYTMDLQWYKMLIKISEIDWGKVLLPEKIIIYGAGKVGKVLCEKVKGKCEVVAFVDEHEAEADWEGIPIYNLRDVKCDKTIPYMVTPVHDYENICREIKAYNAEAVVVSLEEWTEKNGLLGERTKLTKKV